MMLKKKRVSTLWSKPQIHHIGDYGLRDKADLQLRSGAFGFMKNGTLLDIEQCPALSERLLKFLNILRTNPPPIPKASVRIRIAPSGAQGLWIDAANHLIAQLLKEGNWLSFWTQKIHIEIGQKRKSPTWINNQWKLRRASLYPWWKTPLANGDEALLYTFIGAFTQPSLSSNNLLVNRLLKLTEHIEGKTWVEYGAGCGNLTLPMASSGKKIIASELDRAAREGLKKSAKENNLSENIQTTALNLERNTAESRAIVQQADALLVDPPRGGLRGFLDHLKAVQPPNIIYVACGTEALLSDAQTLINLGYDIAYLEGINQFPLTPHTEWIVHFKRS
ncbi:MAG: hypothetical protein CMK59_08525 [Proteobacteria bacterium]|nr:hypothetical protein [Pseudomonadota bacterium]